eukprot:gene1075-1218_t
MFRTREETSYNTPLLANVEKLVIGSGFTMNNRSFKAIAKTMPRLRSLICNNHLLAENIHELGKCTLLTNINFSLQSYSYPDMVGDILRQQRQSTLSKILLPKRSTGSDSFTTEIRRHLPNLHELDLYSTQSHPVPKMIRYLSFSHHQIALLSIYQSSLRNLKTIVGSHHYSRPTTLSAL